MKRYIVKSLELHLFFARIMKEHAVFLQAGFTPADGDFAKRAAHFQTEFERLLCEVVTLSNGTVGAPVLASGEVVTEFTALAERQTECFTGIPIDQEITARELRLQPGQAGCVSSALAARVRRINCTALTLLDGLIRFKETVLNRVLRCQMFTGNYPLLIEHIIREAKRYRCALETLEREGDLAECPAQSIECFWNQIMMEHAQFIRGSLDPTEGELIETADGFAQDYSRLLRESCDAHSQALRQASLAETEKFRDFKVAGTQGIQQCRIRSVILPLLADHVLREANRYIRLLK